LFRNQWTQIFASISTDIGSQLPLWAVQDDGVPGVDTVDTFMGGWTTAAAKQYNIGKSSLRAIKYALSGLLMSMIDTTACGFSADLNSFSS
jgi:hypothetical protein